MFSSSIISGFEQRDTSVVRFWSTIFFWFSLGSVSLVEEIQGSLGFFSVFLLVMPFYSSFPLLNSDIAPLPLASISIFIKFSYTYWRGSFKSKGYILVKPPKCSSIYASLTFIHSLLFSSFSYWVSFTFLPVLILRSLYYFLTWTVSCLNALLVPIRTRVSWMSPCLICWSRGVSVEKEGV